VTFLSRNRDLIDSFRRIQRCFSISSGLRKLFIPPDSQIRPLDGLRALSILWVIAFHTAFFTGLFIPKDRYEALHSSNLLRPVWNGSYGVDVFFVMSGFLICHMLIQEYESGGKISICRFYSRRALRLLPAYYLSLGIFYFFKINDPSTIWANLLYMNNFIPWDRQYMQWAWSLAIEEQFYIVFPVFLVSLYRLKRGRLAVLLGLLVLAFIIRLLVYMYEVPHSSYLDALYVKPYGRYGAILCGVIAAYLVTYSQIIEVTARTPRLVSVSLALVGVGIAIMSLGKNIIFMDGMDNSPWSLFYMSSSHYLLAAGIAWVIIVSIRPVGFAQTISRFLSWKLWYPVAQLSYSTYLIHPMVIFSLYCFWRPNTPLLVWVTIPIICFLSLGASMFMYLFIERPFMEIRSATSASLPRHSLGLSGGDRPPQ
jgi:peptidoglycan/LPS O-acetylase OafA/YrhL